MQSKEGKMKRVFSTVVMLAMFVFYAGIVHAEDAPASSVTFPFLCEVPPAKTNPFMKFVRLLRTSFAVAETAGNETYGIANLRDRKGDLRLDLNAHLTQRDVISSNCAELINMMSATGKDQLKMVIDGKTYYAGSVEYKGTAESLIGWGNFFHTGIQNETDAGFNGVPNLFDPQLGVAELFPRYNIINNKTDTLNWWIILTPKSQGNFCTRILQCIICDEDEHCLSLALSMPNALNVFNVEDYVPGGLFPYSTFPKAGFAACEVAMQSQPYFDDGCWAIRDDKVEGWLYQYTQGISSFSDRATMLPMHVQHQYLY
jgi:hypothetical protein